MVEKRFHVLRIVATISKVLGWIILVVGTLASLGILIAGLVGGAGASQFIHGPQLATDRTDERRAGWADRRRRQLFSSRWFILCLTYGMGEVDLPVHGHGGEHTQPPRP